MSIGETVLVTEGPFLGVYGTIIGSLRHRVVVAVVCGSREVQVEMARDWTIATPPGDISTLVLKNHKKGHEACAPGS
jgi:hypothetical protein